MRVGGVDIPDNKRIDIALSYIYGIGRSNASKILKAAKIDFSIRAKDLTADQVKKIQKILEGYKVEGNLRAEIAANIKRYKVIGSYRGLRHARNLPVRGQRTRTNARTKRGKRVTIGAIKKSVAVKMGIVDKEVPTETKKGGQGK